MFTMKNINVQNFIDSVMRNNDPKYLKELEDQVETFINKYEQLLCLNDTIEDVLDIRDSIILRQSHLRRKALLSKYLVPEPINSTVEFTCGCIGPNKSEAKDLNKDNISFCTSHRLLDDRNQILKKEIKRINKVLNDRVSKS